MKIAFEVVLRAASLETYRIPEHITTLFLTIDIFIRLGLHANDPWSFRDSKIWSPVESGARTILFLDFLLFFDLSSLGEA